MLTMRICLMPRSGFQSFLSELTQISPLLDTLGWNIRVRKNPLGGAAGKSLPSTSLILNWPPAYGVPTDTEDRG